jgi:hypothetical protein
MARLASVVSLDLYEYFLLFLIHRKGGKGF